MSTAVEIGRTHVRPTRAPESVGSLPDRDDLDRRIAGYLSDPLVARLFDEVTAAGHLRSITVDLTEVCNLRCKGCYFFVENMDDSKSPRDEADFDAFIAREQERGTNFVTVLGGEPSLRLNRLRKLHESFRVVAVTNGLRHIPEEGFETMPIAISVWGDHETDTDLRGDGERRVFARALENYRDDERAFWYYTVTAGSADEVESVVTQCVENGNYVYFNYYEDNADIGGALSHANGFERVREAIDGMIDRFPDRIVTTKYLNRVATTGKLKDMTWGYDVCPNISTNAPRNLARLDNNIPYNRHFRAYNPDLTTVRRCCVGEDRDCSKCYNAYARHTWIMVNKARFMGSAGDFARWLTSVYTFYLLSRSVDHEAGMELLPEIHELVGAVEAGA